MIEKPKLFNVTIIAVAGNNQMQTISALYKCKKQVDAAKFILITNADISCNGIEVINVGGLDTWEKYNHFLIKELYKYFDTKYCLIIQHDGYILDGGQWWDNFLSVDYIGAKWFDHERPYNVGNGGFSLRSHKLQKILGTDDFINVTCPEDNTIAKYYRSYLEQKYDIKYADEKLADKFSFELNAPINKTFGFHGNHHQPFKETVVIKRTFAMGDCIMCEPLMLYFHVKGFQVAFDSNPNFQHLFYKHYFPVIPKQNLPKGLPYREINLDGAYEAQPLKNHLESYYDIAGVPKDERVMRNPILSLDFAPVGKNKLFDKYCILHIDNRLQEYRNIHGIDWVKIVKLLNKKGYTVIQLGNGDAEQIEGAITMNTLATPFLMWVCGCADLFVGIDSGIAHICSGFNVPSVIFTGSVDLRLIYPDISNKLWINNNDKNVCERKMCWHHSIGQTGTECYIDNDNPPCSIFDTDETIEKIKTFLNGQNNPYRTSNRKSKKQSV